MEFKLKSGRKLKLKDVSLDDRDAMLDGVEYQTDSNGKIIGVSMMNSTITKWLRMCIDGDTSDEFLKSMTFEERTEIFLKMQKSILVGEEKDSN